MFDDYIFVQPSFLRGVARAVDIGGSLGRAAFVTSPSPRAADARAIASDWRITNRDLNEAMATAGHGAEPEA